MACPTYYHSESQVNTDLRFDSHELALLKECPAALEWLADYHALRSAEAEAMDCVAIHKSHEARSATLHNAAIEAQKKIDSGNT
jgi:hypothetical protein